PPVTGRPIQRLIMTPRHGREKRAACLNPVTDGTVGWATFSFPSPLPSPLWRGRMVHRPLIPPVPELAQRPSDKHQADACVSLSLRERVRVRGNHRSTATGCRVREGLIG